MLGMNRLIMGKNCICEVLESAPDRLIEVFMHQEGGPLWDACRAAGVRVRVESKGRLSKMVDSDSHQSVVARVHEKEPVDLREFLARERESGLVVMLDSIFDPHNMGAILRACECFGADLVVYSKNRGTDVTPTVTKTSAGASELVPLCKVSNLAETVSAFQKADFWVVAAELSKRSQPLSRLNFPEKTLLVVGSEGKGIQPLISKRCDHHVVIPMSGRIDSLNVSQATAVLLSAYRTANPSNSTT